jgi:hypothetical protein
VLRLLYEALNDGEQGEELSKLHNQGVELLQRFERSGHVTSLESNRNAEQSGRFHSTQQS